MIREGKVVVNDVAATVGMSADPEIDKITVDGFELVARPDFLYIMLNKPKGYICTLSDERGRKTILDLLKDLDRRVFPVGRLDMDSEGLLIMTNDGELANKLMHPRHEVKKTYRLNVVSEDIERAIIRIKGIRELQGEYIKEASVELVLSKGYEHVLNVTIGEGKNRQVRRMCEAAGIELKNLRRIRMGNLELGGLKRGSWRFLSEAEIKGLNSLFSSD